MRVVVVRALAQRQVAISLQVSEGTTAGQVVALSGLAAAGQHFGIGGKMVEPGRMLRDGDRVEILRPLALDPRETRRLRARVARSRRQS